MPSEGLFSAEPSSGKAQLWGTQCARGRSVVLCVQAVAPGDSPCTEMSAFGQQRLNPWSNESAKYKIISNASFILITNVPRKVITPAERPAHLHNDSGRSKGPAWLSQ